MWRARPVHFRPGAGVELSPKRTFSPSTPKMADGRRAFLSALVKVTDMARAALIGLYHNLAQTGRTLGMACGRCAHRRAADQGNGALHARWIAMWPVRSLVLCRVGEGVTILAPYRPGRAEFPRSGSSCVRFVPIRCSDDE